MRTTGWWLNLRWFVLLCPGRARRRCHGRRRGKQSAIESYLIPGRAGSPLTADVRRPAECVPYRWHWAESFKWRCVSTAMVAFMIVNLIALVVLLSLHKERGVRWGVLSLRPPVAWRKPSPFPSPKPTPCPHWSRRCGIRLSQRARGRRGDPAAAISSVYCTSELTAAETLLIAIDRIDFSCVSHSGQDYCPFYALWNLRDTQRQERDGLVGWQWWLRWHS